MTATAPAGNGGPPELEGGDFYAPLFLTLAPDGQIAFDFEGHIRAEGLDLLAGTNDTPPDDRKVRWLEEGTDAPVAALYGYLPTLGNPTRSLQLDALADPAAGEDAQAILTAGGTDPSSNQGASASLIAGAFMNAGANAALSNLRAFAEAVDLAGSRQELRTLIDDLGRSHFLQLAGAAADWRLRHVPITHDLASIAAGASVNVALPAPAGTVAIGDPIIFLGVNSRAASWGLLSITPESPASVADEIRLNIANTHTAALNFGPTDFDFHVVNRA